MFSLKRMMAFVAFVAAYLLVAKWVAHATSHGLYPDLGNWFQGMISAPAIVTAPILGAIGAWRFLCFLFRKIVAYIERRHRAEYERRYDY